MECSDPPRLGPWPFGSKKQRRDLEPVAQPELLQTAEGAILRCSPLNYDLGVGGFGVSPGVAVPSNKPDTWSDIMPYYTSGGGFHSQINPFSGSWLSNSVCVQSPYFVAACQHDESADLVGAANFGFVKSLVGSALLDSYYPDLGSLLMQAGDGQWIEALFVDVDILVYGGRKPAACSFYLVYFDEIDVVIERSGGAKYRDVGFLWPPLYTAGNPGRLWDCNPPQCFASYKTGGYFDNDFDSSQQPCIQSGSFRSRVVKEWHFSTSGSPESTFLGAGTNAWFGQFINDEVPPVITGSNPLNAQFYSVTPPTVAVDPIGTHRIRERVDLGLRIQVGSEFGTDYGVNPSCVPWFMNQKQGSLLLYFYSDIPLGMGSPAEYEARPITDFPRGCIHSNLYYRVIGTEKVK